MHTHTHTHPKQSVHTHTRSHHGRIATHSSSHAQYAQWKVQVRPLALRFHFQRRCQKFSNGLFPRWTCEIKATCLTFRCECEIHKSEDQRLTGLGSEHFFTHVCVFPALLCFEFTFKFYFSFRVITLKNFKNGVANEKAVKAQLFFCFFGPTVVRM